MHVMKLLIVIALTSTSVCAEMTVDWSGHQYAPQGMVNGIATSVFGGSNKDCVSYSFFSTIYGLESINDITVEVFNGQGVPWAGDRGRVLHHFHEGTLTVTTEIYRKYLRMLQAPFEARLFIVLYSDESIWPLKVFPGSKVVLEETHTDGVGVSFRLVAIEEGLPAPDNAYEWANPRRHTRAGAPPELYGGVSSR